MAVERAYEEVVRLLEGLEGVHLNTSSSTCSKVFLNPHSNFQTSHSLVPNLHPCPRPCPRPYPRPCPSW